MSLILDALKKSEAERRLGQTPGLLSPAPAARRRHGLWPLLAVLVLAVGLSTGITWWLLRPTPVADPAPGAVEPSASARAATATPGTADAPQPARSSDATAAPIPATVRLDPPPAAAARTVRPATERESAALPAGGALPMPPAPEPAAAAPARSAGTTTPTPPTPAATGARIPVAAAADSSADVTAATGSDARVEPALPGLRALPQELQSALPPLSVSMHVFNQDPAQRFVLIDGRRYGEGMTVADGLLIEAIRRDGVVLAFRGHRFLLPRPG